MLSSGIVFTLYLSILGADYKVSTWAMGVWASREACLNVIDDEIENYQEFYKDWIVEGSHVKMTCVPGQSA